MEVDIGIILLGLIESLQLGPNGPSIENTCKKPV
jgi:hypothetical protein